MKSEEEIRDMIKNKRKQLGYTYDELAAKSGLNKSTLQRYETGSIRSFSLRKAYMLSRALDVPVEGFLGEEFEKAEGKKKILKSPRKDLLEKTVASFIFRSLEHGYSLSSSSTAGFTLILGKDGRSWVIELVEVMDSADGLDKEGLMGEVAEKIGRLVFLDIDVSRYTMILGNGEMVGLMRGVTNSNNSNIRIEFLEDLDSIQFD